MKFYDVYNEYLIYAKNRHKKQGFNTICQNFKKHILPYFKDLQLSDLTKNDIINWQNKILEKDFKNNFNRNLFYEFSAFMNFCVLKSYLNYNLVLQVGKFQKKIEEDNSDFYTYREFRKFRRGLKNFVYRQYFNFIFFCGTRPGETMALRFNDFKRRYIYVRHSIERKGNRSLCTPKNQSSIRIFKISISMCFRLWLLKFYYYKHYKAFRSDFFIFGGMKPLSPTTIDRYKLLACKKAKIRPITQHQFRHSYATNSIHRGVSIDTVSKNMGHSQVSMTVNTYLHQEKKSIQLLFR